MRLMRLRCIDNGGIKCAAILALVIFQSAQGDFSCLKGVCRMRGCSNLIMLKNAVYVTLWKCLQSFGDFSKNPESQGFQEQPMLPTKS
jgi:hypothetical protein